jgi:hypothetical protein
MQCTYYEYIYGWFVKQETDTYMYMIYIVLIYYWVHHDFRVKNIYSSNLCSICVLCSLVYHRYFCIWICPCSTWGILYETQRSLLNLGYSVWNTAVLAQLGVFCMKHSGPCSTWGTLYETQRSLLNLGYAVWNTPWALLLMWRSRQMNFNQYIFDQFVLGILCQSLSSLSHHWLDPWVIFLVADNPRLHSLVLFKHHGAVVAVIVW